MIALYARVSTQEQALNGHSIDEQIDRMQKFCEAYGWQGCKTYVDAGFSGSNMTRPALQSLIRDIQNHKVDKILVYKLDRLSRSQKDTLWLIEDVMLASGCDFVSISENFDTSAPLGRAMIGILAVFAQLEREQIKERMIMGKSARAKQGLFGGSKFVPIGYDYVDGHLVTNDFEKMQVIRIFNEYASGRSPQMIASDLNHAGLTHKIGSWNPKTIRTILSKRTYLGFTYYNGEWFQGEHEPFIDANLFERVQAIRNQKMDDYKKNRRNGKINSYLAGLIVCKNCGAKYSKVIANGKYSYYSCNSRNQKKESLIKDRTCKNKNWRMDELDAIVFDEIKKLATDPEQIQTIQTEKNDSRPQIISEKIKSIDSQLAKLLDLYTIDSMPIDVLQERIHGLNDQRTKLENELLEIENEKKGIESTESAIKLIKSFSDVLETGSLNEIHSLISALIDHIEIDGDNIEIYWAFA